ncbi:serine hydrolase domain-containing protein [Leucobacter chinensis]|uniref:serine hydrolase domain-containing protein n=1 Tax=Leucobacter chinensis TaxID=2851010 RepID=UPI001C222E8F|nr:serine hydrolase domain-containing protein [Leucobacter chinensis]
MHSSPSDIQALIESRAAELLERHQVPGVGIGLRVGDETVTLGVGVTNLEHPLPVTGDTIFQVGSISKTFVGVVAAQLVNEGMLDIDKPVAPLLADLGPLDRRITMRHLLTHSAGIDAQYMIGNARQLLAHGADDSIQASIAHFASDVPMFAPGTNYSYSGPGFMVAGAVIERLTGKPWHEVLQERVLDPASMGRTFTRADQAITHRVAAPHDITDGVARIARNEGWQLGWQLPGWDVPGGGVLSTPAELLSYVEFALEQDAQTQWSTTLQQGHEPRLAIGYAWMKSEKRGLQTLGHDGLTIGYASRLTVLPEADVAIVLLSNSVKGKPLVRELEQLILDGLFGPEEAPHIPDFEPERYAFLEGLYDCGFYGQVDLRIRADRSGFELISLPANRQDGSFTIDPLSSPILLPVADGVLSAEPRSSDPDHWVPYIVDESGEAIALRIGSRIAKKVAS